MPRLITLGGLFVRNGAVVNGVANPRSRLAILAVLAVSGDRGIRREKLAGLFWPDSDEERARNALRQSLFKLKRDIGAGEITLGVADLRLNPDVLTADVTEFDAAVRAARFEEAAGLYGGSFLDGVYIRESPEFERWVEEHRARLSAEYGRALEKAAAEATVRGDARSAAGWWERRAAHDPLSGRIARFYMEALFAAGEREKAIRHAAVHAQLVRQELDAEPDPDVLLMADRLRETTEGSVDVRRGASSTLPASPEDLLPAPVSAPRPPEAATTDVDRNGGKRVLSGRGVAFALAVLTIALTSVAARVMSTKGPPIQPGLVALGVLENRTEDAGLNPVATAAMSTLTEVLTLSGHAGVMDALGSLREARGVVDHDVERDVETAARRSPAEYLVRGFMDHRGDSLVVTAQVVRPRSGQIALQIEPVALPWTVRERLPGEFRELVGGAVVALGDTLFPLWRTGRSRPPRYSAYHEFRQGLDALVNQGMRAAILHFVKAMELDPQFAQAKLWYLEQAIAVPAEKERMDSVRAALEAQRASFVAYDQLAVDRQLAYNDRRIEDAYTAARQMVAVAPESPDARILLAQAAMATRRFREAIDMLHSIRVAPAWFGGLGQRRGWDLQAHRLLGDLDVALTEWRRAVADAPDQSAVCAEGFSLLAAAGRESEVDSLLLACDRLPDAQPDMDRHLQTAGRNYRMRGHDAAAERAFRRALSIRQELAAKGSRPQFGVALLHIELNQWREAYDILRSLSDSGMGARLALGLAAAHVGDTVTARTTMQWFESNDTRGGAAMNRGFIQLALGQRDSALASLRAALSDGIVPAWNAWYVRPELAPLRGDPRFEELVRPTR